MLGYLHFWKSTDVLRIQNIKATSHAVTNII